MDAGQIHLLLADDDRDDCQFFGEALDELPFSTKLTTVYDGEQLMHFLTRNKGPLPYVLFLDLNLPRKNGFECLDEIRSSKLLGDLFTIIFSTSSEKEILNLLYRKGAQFYIRKPVEFSQLKKVIHQSLTLRGESLGSKADGQAGNLKQAPKIKFLLTGD